jgi:energy-coupling factor transporter ATP-binding protein EcfA2
MTRCSQRSRQTWICRTEAMPEPMDRCERVLVKYPLFKTAVSRIQACFDSYETTAEPDCCPIVGESGSGKTTIISYFASLHPRVDRKTGVEAPVLIARVPARPSVKSFAETLLYQLGDPLWSRGNTVSQSIRLRELLKRCRVRLLALDEFQHFVDVRRANIPDEVADWLKEQVEEAKLAIVVLGLDRCLEVLRQNEQLRRRFGSTLRVGAFRWNIKEDRTTYRAFLRAVQDQLAEYSMPTLSDVDMAFRMHYASYGLVGYTMKIIRGAARIASSHPRRQITLHTLSQSFIEHVWSERLGDPNPFLESFDTARAQPPVLPGAAAQISSLRLAARSIGPELHA